MIKYKKYSLYVILLAMFATVALPLNIGIADLSSGSKIFVSDIVIIFVSVVYFGMIMYKKETLNKEQKIFLPYIILFLTYLFFISGIHTFLSGFSKEYITLIRNFYSYAFLLFFYSNSKISRQMIENTLLLFISGANIYQLMYLIKHLEIRSSPLFFNIIIYSLSAQLILCVLFKLSSSRTKEISKFKKMIADINILFILVLIPFSGLRANMTVTYLLVIFYILFFSILHGKKILIKGFLCLLILVLGVIGTFTVANITGNQVVKNILVRTFSVTQIIKKPIVNDKVSLNDGSGAASDAYRSLINKEAIKSIQNSPVIGTGKLLVQMKHQSGKVLLQQPHGFVLEWLIGYGVIGTLIYIGFLFLPYYYKNVRFRKIRYYCMSVSVLLGLLAISTVQPTMSRILPMQIFMVIQVYFMKSDMQIRRNKRKKSIQHNALKENKSRTQNINNKELRELQILLLKNMKIIHEICVKHNIVYSLWAGSGIGATLYQGFLPWDDDIDIIMDRKNYDKFYRVAQKEFPENLELVNYKNSGEMRSLISKVVDKDILVTYQNTNGEELEMGLFIDISVLDKVSTDERRKQKAMRKSKLGLLLIGRNTPKNQGFLIKVIGWILVKCTTERFKINFGNRTETYIKRNVRKGESYTYAEMLVYLGEVREYDENLFSRYQLIAFEDTYLYIVNDYNRYLCHRYNVSRLIIPPKEEQVPHHGIISIKKSKVKVKYR